MWTDECEYSLCVILNGIDTEGLMLTRYDLPNIISTDFSNLGFWSCVELDH